MRVDYPKISCICVTDSRPYFLQRAIDCFQSQDYPNKEMIISYPIKDISTKNLLAEMKYHNTDIITLERADKESVGNARNLAIEKCTAEYICVWDDDDWNHANRLSYQYNAMKESKPNYSASVLTNVLLFDQTTKKAYLSSHYTWENTLLCRREIILQNQYAHRNKGEDTHIIQFLEKRKFLFHVDEAPFLYVYIFHGGNTWDYEHYSHLISKGVELDEALTKNIINLVK